MTNNSADKTGQQSLTGRDRLYDIATLALFSAVCYVVLFVTGNLTAGPRVVDDNQVYRLQFEFEERGFLDVLRDEIRTRFEMNRLVPLHCVHKVVQARLFGSNLVAWSLWVTSVGVISAWLLFYALRLCEYSRAESLAFALITVIGEQSVLWWRLMHGEGLGLLLVSGALVLMAKQIRTGKAAYEYGFVLLVCLALLSKESFILIVPGLLALKITLTCRLQDVTLLTSLRKNVASVFWIGGVGLTLLLIIRFGIERTHFGYAGWQGFDLDIFNTMVRQYGQISNAWLLAALAVILVIAWKLRLFFFNRQNNEGSGEAPQQWLTWTDLRQSSALIVVFWLFITVPQVLLYMKTGMLDTHNEIHFSRYIVPCILGSAFVTAELLRLIRLATGGTSPLLWIALSLVCVSIGLESKVAYEESVRFATISAWNNEWIEEIVEHTDPESPIVLVYLNDLKGAFQTQVALRVYYILTRRHHRTNVYCLPLPPGTTIAEGARAAVYADIRHHGQKLRGIEQMEPGAEAEAIAVLNFGGLRGRPKELGISTVVEEHLLEYLEGDWFDPDKYDRKMSTFGHIVYLRKKT